MNPGWDVSQAAGAHAALAGVLAGIVLVLLPVVASRGITPVAGSAGEPAISGAGRALHTLQLLVLALVYLVLSAVLWGGLAGHPKLEAVQGLPDEQWRLYLGREWGTGGAAVVLLALGALALVAGVFEAVRGYVEEPASTTDQEPAMRRSQRDQLDTLMFRILAAVGILAFYQVAFFGFSGAFTLWSVEWSSNFWALAVTSAVALVAAMVSVRLDRLDWPPQFRDSGRRPSTRRQLSASVVSATSAILLYALQAVPEPFEAPDKAGSLDVLTFVLFVAAGAGFTFYAYATAMSARPSVVHTSNRPLG